MPEAGGPRLLLPTLVAVMAAHPVDATQSAQVVPDAPPIAAFEDYRTPVGTLVDGALRVTLDATEITWLPWGEDGARVRVHAFAADGARPRVPGPLIRVEAGTPVRVTLRNTLSRTLVVRGLRDRGHEPLPGPIWAPFLGDSVALAPGAAAEVAFTPTAPGTYFYYGRVRRPGDEVVPPFLFGGDREDGPFVGVLIVDPPGAAVPADERIFLMTQWMDRAIRDSWDPSLKMMINGRSWPATERHEYTQGEPVHWRVLNATGIEHPMHLHGFFFDVEAKGDQWREVAYAPGEAPSAVTETVGPGETMRLRWVPTEAGNWIFHCHLMRHMSGVQGPPSALAGEGSRGTEEHAEDPMAGLVVGITVRPPPGARRAAEVPRRRLRLFTGARPAVFGDEPAYGFVLQEGAAPPAADSVRIPGSPLVLTRGEPTEIVVHNRLDFPLGVHWHGLELESWADGVPGWSGTPDRVRPAIAPGDSFAVRMTPPRAGTFMYHVHSEPAHELSQGLYGAFLVVEPGDTWDPTTDRLFVLGSLGAGINAPAAVNGRTDPGPVELRAGTSYRFRFMHISPDDRKQVRLLATDQPVEWRALAKDGAALPPSRARSVPADLQIRVGETYDFVWTPEGVGEFILRIITTFESGPPAFRFGGPPPHTLDIPVRVR